jgi:transcriptional regulator with GAF, ATPase, and Fis domain
MHKRRFDTEAHLSQHQPSDDGPNNVAHTACGAPSPGGQTGPDVCDDSSDSVRRKFAALGFVTASDAALPLLQQAAKAAAVSDVTILLEGETGTGKRVLAQAIHHLDEKRKHYPFVTAHCSTISEGLAESEFFGHHRGAFTGALKHRSGLFQTANCGTLLLDDVNDLTLSIQPKLLDVIQRGVLRPLGSDREIPINVRIIAASNQPLHPLVIQNRFRSDLFHRLNVVRLRLPALRERQDDLAALILVFAYRYRSIYHPVLSVDAELVKLLQSQAFCGNVRELENTVVRMLFAKTTGTVLGVADWIAQDTVEAASERAEDQTDLKLVDEAAQKLWQMISQLGVPYAKAMHQIEKKLFETALKAEGGAHTRKEVASQLRTSERTLYNKIRAYRLSDRRIV